MPLALHGAVSEAREGRQPSGRQRGVSAVGAAVDGVAAGGHVQAQVGQQRRQPAIVLLASGGVNDSGLCLREQPPASGHKLRQLPGIGSQLGIVPAAAHGGVHVEHKLTAVQAVGAAAVGQVDELGVHVAPAQRGEELRNGAVRSLVVGHSERHWGRGDVAVQGLFIQHLACGIAHRIRQLLGVNVPRKVEGVHIVVRGSNYVSVAHIVGVVKGSIEFAPP